MSLHYNGANSYLFVNGIEMYKFKAKDSEFNKSFMSRKHFKDWTVDHMKKTGWNGYFFDFSADYDAIAVDAILDIQNYLMKNK